MNIINDDLIKCPLCDKQGKLLKEHITTVHKLTKDQFYEQFPDAVLVAPSCHRRRSENTTRRNYEWWDDPEYREHMVKVLNDNAPTRCANWTNSEDRKRNPEKYLEICRLGGKALMEKHGQRFLTEGKLNSKLFHDTKSHEMRAILEKLHDVNDSTYADVRAAIYGPKSGGRKDYQSVVGTVRLRSSFEFSVHEILIKSSIKFEYEPDLLFNYTTTDGTVHRYFPDFYLPDYNLIIEVKPDCYCYSEIFKLKARSVIDSGYRFTYLTESEVFSESEVLKYITHPELDVT